MSDAPMNPDGQDLNTNVRRQFGGLLRPIIISAVLPLVIYLLASPRMSSLAALALSAVPPALYSIYGWVRLHSIDPISIVTICMVVLFMLLALLVHDPHLFLLRDTTLTAAFGLLCLISLLFEKPVAYYVYRWLFVHTPEQRDAFNARSLVPYGRFFRRFVTLVWGVSFTAEALLDSYLVFHLPTARFLTIHPLLFWGTIVATMGWATSYSRNAQKKIDLMLRQTARNSRSSPVKVVKKIIIHSQIG